MRRDENREAEPQRRQTERGDDRRRPALGALLRFALRVDQPRCLRLTRRLRQRHPDASDRELAEKLVAFYARRGAAAGFVSGLAANPLLALPAAVVDVVALLRFYANLSATVGCLANPSYFDVPGWEADALVILAGRRAVSRVLQGIAVEGVKRGSHGLLQRQARAAVVRALGPGAAGRIGAKIAHRALAAKLVPILGGLVGGAWNYVEMRAVGRRIVRLHFGEPAPPAPRQKRAPRSPRATRS